MNLNFIFRGPRDFETAFRVDMDDAATISVGVEELLSFFFKRVAGKNNKHSDRGLGTIKKSISRRCNDPNGSLQRALKT